MPGGGTLGTKLDGGGGGGGGRDGLVNFGNSLTVTGMLISLDFLLLLLLHPPFVSLLSSFLGVRRVRWTFRLLIFFSSSCSLQVLRLEGACTPNMPFR